MCRPGGRVIYRPPGIVHKPSPFQQTPPAKHACPLTGVEAHVIIKDFCASIALSQKFQNVEEQPIEAVYQFPLNDKYCICDFTAEIDGKVIKGECKEKEEAKDIYDDAISEGHGAYLLEQDDDNVFKVNVGNLAPGKEVNITITYVAELEFVEGALQYILASSPVEEGPTSPYYRATTSKAPLPGLKLKVDLEMTSNIRSLSSPTHPISFEFGEEPTQAVVTLGDATEVITKDFILNVKLAKPHQPCGKVQKDKKGNLAAMVALYPEIKLGEDEEIYTECVFLIDRSGSMSGSRINQVRDTMQIFLRSLGEGTMFNIVGFGSRSDFLFKNGSVEYNDKNLETATQHISTLAANLGGTNILGPLQEILKAPTVEGYPRQLFILTDGEVGNTQACIDFVRKNSHTTRVFTFGIGGEASQELVKGMAKAGEGHYEFILSGENMEEKVLKQLGRAMQPALTDITVDWGELPVEQAPYRLPPLFLGGRLVVYGFLPEGTKEGTVTLRAKTAIAPFETSVEIKPQEAAEGELFHKLGAKQLIRDLQEARSFMHNLDGSLMSGRNPQKVKEEMIRLSTNYGVLCEHTAFVAVEERSEATEGTMQVRKIGMDTAEPSSKKVNKPSSSLTTSTSTSSSAPVWGVSQSSTTTATPTRNGGAAAPQKNSFFGGLMKKKEKSNSKDKEDKCKKGSVATSRRKSSAEGAVRGGAIGGGGGGGRGGAPAARGRGMAAPSSPTLSLKRASSPPPSAPPSFALNSSMSAPPPPPSAHYGAPPSPCGPPPPGGPPPPSASYGAPPPPSPSFDGLVMSKSLRSEECEQRQTNMPARPTSSSVSAPSPARGPAPVSGDMRTLIMKQKANGSWAFADVSSLLGSISAESVKKAIAALVKGDVSSDVEALWMTAVVCAFLEARFPDQKTGWDLVVKKAKRWITKQAKTVSVQPEGLDFVGEATKFVAAN